MRVIIGRALPDARDGLKPAHRRVLYAMTSDGPAANRRYSKCAGVVGEVIGKLPSRTATRPSTTRSSAWRRTSTCATRWSTARATSARSTAIRRRPMRYTEAPHDAQLAERAARRPRQGDRRLRPQLRRDHRTSRPSCRRRFPNLLVNGSTGIAVGMATNIPPHNLREVIDALIALDRAPGADRRRADAVHPGPGLPDRRLHRRPRADPRGLPRPAAASSRCARKAEIETDEKSGRVSRSSSPRFPTR